MKPLLDRDMAARLATVYAALASRSAPEPPASYLGEMAERLSQWTEPEVSAQELVRIVDEAVRNANSTENRAALGEAIRELRVFADQPTRRAFLYDLVQLALHDDWYMHEEGRFISAVARRWNIHPVEAGRSRLWSVMDSHTSETDWTPVHDLALIYLALAHQADAELSQAELDAITKKLGEWLPAALPSDVVIVVSEALHIYARGADPQLLRNAVERVKRNVPMHQRAAIVADLEYVARADQIVLVEEKAIIAELAAAWGVEHAAEV